MSKFTPADGEFIERVRVSFARQQVMQTIGAMLTVVDAGQVEIQLPFRRDLTQQHGFLHAGIVATIADSACGYAAFSLMPADVGVLSVEYKLNLLAAADGDVFVARGQVIKAGRNITVCEAAVLARKNGSERAVAAMLATMMTVRDRPGVSG